jgi:hypothetical protein
MAQHNNQPPSQMASLDVLKNVYLPPKQLTFDEKADLAFKYLKELMQEKYRFTNEQIDIGVKLPLNLLPPNDQETITDIARHNGVPLWQAVWAQFRRANEQGFAYALLLDPGWLQEEVMRSEQRECPVCHAVFLPTNQGMKFCSNLCGAAKDREAVERNRPKDDFAGPAILPSAEGTSFVPIGAENVLAGN